MIRTIPSHFSSFISNNNSYLSIRLQDVYWVWIKSNNQFVILQSPAYFVFSATVFGQSKEEILKTFSEIYFYKITEAQQFIHEISELTKSYLSKPIAQSPSTAVLGEKKTEIQFRNSYQIGGQQIAISGNNKSIRRYFYPLISHLEVTSESSNLPEIELGMEEGVLSIRKSPQAVEAWREADNGFFKGALFAEILSKAYRKEESDWMLTMHASGITDGNSAILFSAPAGRGKSTVAAWLHAAGYDLLSDDFLAIDQDANVYRFPLALTVKAGSFDVLSPYFEELKDIEPVMAANSKLVRYLPPKSSTVKKFSFPIKAVVFVNFIAESSLECVELSTAEAIQILLPEIFVHPVESNIIGFMHWVESVSFYQLTYSNVEQIAGVVKQIYAEE